MESSHRFASLSAIQADACVTHNHTRSERLLMSRTSQSGDLPQWGFSFSSPRGRRRSPRLHPRLGTSFCFFPKNVRILSQLLIWNTWEYSTLCNISPNPPTLLGVQYKLRQITVNTLALVFVCQPSNRGNKDDPFIQCIVSGQKKRHVQQTVEGPFSSEWVLFLSLSVASRRKGAHLQT